MKTRTMLVVGLAVCGQAVAGTCVMESARKIPLMKETDVLVVGGSSGAVTAALAAKARSEISEDSGQSHTETVARGTPIFEAVKNDDGKNDPEKNGVMSILATVKEFQIMNLIPAA